jgi:hypothetical protein
LNHYFNNGKVEGVEKNLNRSGNTKLNSQERVSTVISQKIREVKNASETE